MTSNKRVTRRIRKPLNIARSHWLYNESEVRELYGISRNTLITWRGAGLAAIEGGENRIFRGCDLNRFQQERREKAKRPCKPDEVFCLRCKNLHSILIEPYRIERRPSGLAFICMTCPDTGRDIRKFVCEEPDLGSLVRAESRSSPGSHDYIASSNSAEFGQNASFSPYGLVPDNEHLVYGHQIYLLQVEGQHEKTVDAALRAIRTLQTWIGPRPFQSVTIRDIAEFKTAYEKGYALASLNDASNTKAEPRTRGSSTIVHCFAYLEAFYRWLHLKAGCKKIAADLPDYFSPSRHHVHIAAASTPKRVPSLEELKVVLRAMPGDTWRQRRDRALVAFLCLSGMRDGAVIGLKRKHVNLEKREVEQDPNEIKTKNSKTMRTWWFPIGEEIAAIVVNWIKELEAQGVTDDDALFPQTPPTFSTKLALEPWATATPLRKIVRAAIARAGMEPFRPHAIRSMLARLGDVKTRTFEERKAWSQNLGHEHIATTETYYAKIDDPRQGEIFESLWKRADRAPQDELTDLIEEASPECIQAIRTLLFASRR